MANQQAKAEFNSFVKGLITETNQLTSVDTSFQDGKNVEINKIGSLFRRNGIDWLPDELSNEIAVSLEDISLENLNSFIWDNPGGLSGEQFIVIQITNKLVIFNNSIGEDLNSRGLVGQIDIPYFSKTASFSFAAVNGYLIVVDGGGDILYINYADGSFERNLSRIKVRDIWGVAQTENVGDDDDFNPRNVSEGSAKYNLQNQSWGLPRRSIAGASADPIVLYKTQYNRLPSDLETVWTGLQFQASSDPKEVFYPKLYVDSNPGSSKAPKGYFIIDALTRGASRKEAKEYNITSKEGLTSYAITFEQDETPGGATIVSEFAGRVFYAGFSGNVLGKMYTSPFLNNHIMFSQLVSNHTNIFRCYQEGDPTSREESAVLDTDGGVIKISGLGEVVALKPFGKSLIVFGSNGVWAIKGGNDYGFSATNYSVEKISVFGCNSAKSVVDTGTSIVYFSEGGIYSISVTQTGELLAKSLSELTIKTFYNNLTSRVTSSAAGSLDPFSGKIRWVMHDGTPLVSTATHYELVLDINSGAFVYHEIKVFGKYIIGMIPRTKVSYTLTDEQVDADGVHVVVTSNNVVIDTQVPEHIYDPRYIVCNYFENKIYLAFASYNNDEWLDWNEDDASAYFITSDFTLGDASVNKTIPILTVFMLKTDEGIDSEGQIIHPSSCKVSAQWEWFKNASSNRWSTPREFYRTTRPTFGDNLGNELIVAKDSIRGMGRAFSLKFKSDKGKDMQVVGWHMNVQANTSV